MSDYSTELKKRLEREFSMPFNVSLMLTDGEEQYVCYPSNSEEAFFYVKAYIHDQIRLVVEVTPQNNAWGILNDMAQADKAKQQIFFQYLSVLREKKAKAVFSVNNDNLGGEKTWPETWRFFKCRIDLVPIPENNEGGELVDLLAEWMSHGTALILSLLTIEETTPQSEFVSQEEGGVKEVLSKRYERSRVNREICLAHKGYSCHVCGFNFLEKYGPLGKNYIEVHHTTPVSEMGEGYVIDIDRDLVPVCSNCHSIIHRRKPPYSIEEMKEMIAQNSKEK